MTALLDNTVMSNFAIIDRSDLVRIALRGQAASTVMLWAYYNGFEKPTDRAWHTVDRYNSLSSPQQSTRAADAASGSIPTWFKPS